MEEKDQKSEFLSESDEQKTMKNEQTDSEEQQVGEQAEEKNVEEAEKKTEEQSEGGDAAALKDKYLRLYSEFENFRRRTAKERLELIKTANEDLLKALLPVLDDFERASKAIETASDLQAVKDGVKLIHEKFYKILENRGLKSMECLGQSPDPELHEAVAQIPAPSEETKGKIIDELERGYYLNDKVIRFAKVVTGA